MQLNIVTMFKLIAKQEALKYRIYEFTALPTFTASSPSRAKNP